MRPYVVEPETNVDPDRALELVLAGAAPLEPGELSVLEAVGAVLAEDVLADRDYPPFDRSMMDGYAVRVADAGRELPVAFEVPAGHSPAGPLPAGAVASVMTGAECPEGTEAVVPAEDVERLGDVVRLPKAVVAEENVARQGAERRAGTTVLRAGQVITPLRLALLATVGRATVKVQRPPKVAVITTGDEVVPAGEAPGPAQIRGSNGPMLVAMLEALGLRHVTLLHARDDERELRGALESVAEHDVVLLSGGVSAGRFDLVPVVVAALGGRIVFHRVRQKPGKPLYFAKRGRQLVFGLPGNPLATQFCFHRYVRPAVRALMGRGWAPPSATGRLSAPLAVKGQRTLFQLCTVLGGVAGWEVTPLTSQSSADIFAAASANALARFEPSGEPYAPGTEVCFEWLTGEGPEAAVSRPEGPGGGVGPPPTGALDPSRPRALGTEGLLAPIALRRSLRAFDPSPPPEGLLGRALNAARWAPSAGNGQPWRFVVARSGGALFGKLAATLTPGNTWAGRAPYLVLVAAKTVMEHPDKPPKPNQLALLEVGLALGNLLVQATADGLLAHAFDGFDAATAGEAAGVPDGYRVVVMVAVGRPGDPSTLDERTRAKDERPRRRLPLRDVVFEEGWGAPSAFRTPDDQGSG